MSIIALFIGMSITPSVAVDTMKKPSMLNSIVRTFYVGGSGEGNYTTIQGAINNARDGDTVFVYDDSSPYYENVEVDKSINLKGKNRATTVIDGDRSGTDILISADKVTVSGFTIQGSPVSSYYGYEAGIQIYSNLNTIIGNTFKNNEFSGIYLYNSINNTITGNSFSNNDFFSIHLHNTKNSTITDNYFSNNHEGINLRDSCKNTITDNNFSNNDQDISLEYCSNNIISDNSFFKGGLYVWYSYENIVSNNTINNKPLEYLEDESDIIIDNAGQIILINCDNITIQNQKISHTNIGIQLWYTNNSRISDNIISYNDEGIYLCHSNRNIIQKNNFLLNFRHASLLCSRRNRWKQNYWNRPRIFPKMVFGLDDGFLWIWINFDWRPAKEPYDIEVVI